MSNSLNSSTTTPSGPNLRSCSSGSHRASISSGPAESLSKSRGIRSIVSYYGYIFVVRVGGGYLSIDEFLDQYTPLELEKIERKDPLKRFSEKIVVQKTLVGKEVKE